MKEIANLDRVPSPALLFDADAIEKNIALMVKIAGGDAGRLRPHIKTHKCAEILRQQLEVGIRHVKAATIAEAELSAIAGVPDVLISYPLVGPAVTRLHALIDRYPNTKFSALVDTESALADLVRSDGKTVDLFIDLDVGMHRTGVGPGQPAVALAHALLATPGLRLAGLHAYDGHIHDASLDARKAQFQSAMEALDATLAAMESAGIEIPLIVSGGSPTFALHAERAAQSSRPHQCSPGTTVLWDTGYGNWYPDLPFEPAAFLLVRVISHPPAAPGGGPRICVDLGHKAVAAENPIASRVFFPAIPNAEFIGQSEEHLVLGVDDLDAWPVGTTLLGIPKHVCPTVALHQEARIVRSGAVTDEAWPIGARDRRIHV